MPASAARFYGAVVGWTIPETGEATAGGVDYRMIGRSDGGKAGGVLALDADMLAGGARPFSPGEKPEMMLWMRHRDTGARDSVSGLVALADALPAAALVLFPERAPFSTATWAVDLLVDAPHSDSGWWLLQSVADSAGNGYSTQAMTMWNDHGEAVLVARQNVVVFI